MIYSVMDFFQSVFFIGILSGIISVVLIVGITILLNRCRRRTKMHNSIGATVTKMFRNIEKCTDSEDGQIPSSQIRTVCLHSYIRLLESSITNQPNYLDQRQFIELIHILTKVEERMEKQKPLEDKDYGDVLNEFKKIKWLKIPIEKLDLKAA